MSLRRRFTRPLGERRYSKLYIVATEGEITEPQYFELFNEKQSIVRVKCLKSGKGNTPEDVLRRMSVFLGQEGLKKDDEAWLVADKDQWSDDQLRLLFNWSLKADNFDFALSNPKFEYWLLLHFDDGDGIRTPRECDERPSRYLPDYDKTIDHKKFNQSGIDDAIRRARARDTPPCHDWPRLAGSTVYRLVQSILDCQTGRSHAN